ncbi:MAG: class I SAM-dependent methyltransferase [Chloroflexi bacterium]|nr:class I SAM-dependent methyltransferase [Chloroflexota bacterium]
MATKQPAPLVQRQFIEERFHDDKIKKQQPAQATYLSLPANYAIGKLVQALGDYRGKRILEFGCGVDGLAIYLGRRGAITDGFDISGNVIELARQRVKDYGLDGKVNLKKMSAESLEYPNDSFDIVVGNAILHHCDLSLALEGIWRVLREGGSAYFLEPLDHNFLLKVYRRLTPGERSITEKPLSFADFHHFRQRFAEFEHEEMYLLTLACFLWRFVIPNEYLYRQAFYKFLHLDSKLLRIIPYLNKYCWTTLLKFKK